MKISCRTHFVPSAPRRKGRRNYLLRSEDPAVILDRARTESGVNEDTHIGYFPTGRRKQMQRVSFHSGETVRRQQFTLETKVFSDLRRETVYGSMDVRVGSRDPVDTGTRRRPYTVETGSPRTEVLGDRRYGRTKTYGLGLLTDQDERTEDGVDGSELT